MPQQAYIRRRKKENRGFYENWTSELANRDVLTSFKLCLEEIHQTRLNIRDKRRIQS